jgi:pyrimidine-nucleoside phosphorylase
LTEIHTPMGHAIGNWPEVAESIRCLRGERNPDVMDVTYELAAEMIVLGGKSNDIDVARGLAHDAISSGRALDLFRQLVSAQGGDVQSLDNPDKRQAEANVHTVYYTGESAARISGLDAFQCGVAAIRLGAGRMKKDDVVDPLAGIVLSAKPGGRVNPGDILATLYASNESRIQGAAAIVQAAYSFYETDNTDTSGAQSRLINRYSDGAWMHQPGTLSV